MRQVVEQHGSLVLLARMSARAGCTDRFLLQTLRQLSWGSVGPARSLTEVWVPSRARSVQAEVGESRTGLVFHGSASSLLLGLAWAGPQLREQTHREHLALEAADQF